MCIGRLIFSEAYYFYVSRSLTSLKYQTWTHSLKLLSGYLYTGLLLTEENISTTVRYIPENIGSREEKLPRGIRQYDLNRQECLTAEVYDDDGTMYERQLSPLNLIAFNIHLHSFSYVHFFLI